MKYLKVCCFMLAIGITLITVNSVIMYKNPYGIVQYEGFYEQESNSVDVLFVGTSHVYSNIDPAYVYEETGVMSYDLATGGATLSASYYSIKQALEYQKPDLIVLELYGVFCEQLSQRAIIDATYGLKNPIIKFRSLCENIGENSFIEFWLGFPWYHSLYNDITRNDFGNYKNVQDDGIGKNIIYLYPQDHLQAYKGAVILSSTYPCVQVDITKVDEQSPISEESEKWLRDIITLVQDNDIELCLLSAPFQGITEDMQAQINYINNMIAKPNNLEFIDANLALNEMNMNWALDAGDAGHLNYRGTEKFSRWLSRRLDARYPLRDGRGEEDSDTWEKNLLWQNESYEMFRLKNINDLGEYVVELNNTKADIDVYVSFEGVEWQQYRNKFIDIVDIDVEKVEQVDSFVYENKQWAAHYAGTPEIIINKGVDTFLLNSGTSDGISVIMYNNLIEDVVDQFVCMDLKTLECVR